MADEVQLQQLLLPIEVRTAAFERALNRIEKKTNATFAKVARDANAGTNGIDRALASTERRFTALETTMLRLQGRIGGALRGTALAFAGGFSVEGAERLLDTSTRIRNALRVAGLEGQSLTKVYDALYQSARRNAAPLETLVTLYSRVAQAQDSLGVSQAQLLNFTDKVALALRVAGTDAQTASGALLQLGQALGAGVVRAEEFNSINEGARPILQAVAAGLEEAGGSVAKLRKLVLDGKISSEAFFRAFEVGAVTLESKVTGAQLTIAQSLTNLQNELIAVAGRLDDATGASNATGETLNKLASIVRGLGNVFTATADGPVGTFINKLSQVNDLIRKIEPVSRALGLISEENLNALAGIAAPSGERSEADRIRAEIAHLESGMQKAPGSARIAAQTRIDDLYRRLETATNAGPTTRGGRRGKKTIAAKPITIKDYPVSDPGDDAERAEKTAERLAKSYDRIKVRVDEFIASQLAEADALSLTGRAADAMRFRQDLLNDAIAAGIQVTPEQTKEIEKYAEAMAYAAEAASRASLKQDLVFRRQQAVRSDVDRQIAETLQRYNLPIDLNSADAAVIRHTVLVERAADAWNDVRQQGIDAIDALVGSAFGGLDDLEGALADTARNVLKTFNALAISGPLYRMEDIVA